MSLLLLHTVHMLCKYKTREILVSRIIILPSHRLCTLGAGYTLVHLFPLLWGCFFLGFQPPIFLQVQLLIVQYVLFVQIPALRFEWRAKIAIMAFAAAASPLCTWLIAACVSQTVAGLSSENYPVSSGPLGRRLRRRIARSKKLAAEGWFPNVGIQAGALSGQNLVAFCESGLSELGSFCSLEGCPEYNSSKHSPLFGDGFLFGEGFGGLGSKPVRAARRRLSKAAAGKATAIAVQPVKETPEKKKTATKQRRVVVTGMGLVSCLGHDPQTFYDNLLEGKSGITEIEGFDCKDFPTVSLSCWNAGSFCLMVHFLLCAHLDSFVVRLGNRLV
jgi:hypothetical protein